MHGISTISILIPTLVSEFPILNPSLGKFGPKQSKLFVFPENWCALSRGCCFLFQHLFSEFQILISFFGKFRSKKSKLFVLTENCHTWYLGIANSESGLRLFKFRSQNLFLGKFGSKKSKLFVFPENWHTWHLDDIDSYSNISFLISVSKSIFGQIWAKKLKVVCFA